jgi:hypothetical protein
MEPVLKHIEGQPLLACRRNRKHWLTGAHILADLATPSTGAQDGLAQVPLKHRERGRRCLDLRVRNDALFFGWPRDRGVVVIGLRLGDVSTRARCVVCGLVELLLRGGVALR